MLKQHRYMQPYIPTNSYTPYRGNELQALTSDTPFLRGQGIPITAYRPVVRNSYGAPKVGLKLGDRGQEVIDLQAIVGAEQDGIFGTKTQTKLMSWQSANGLTPTGMVDLETLLKLQGRPSNPTLTDKVTQGATTAASLFDIFKTSRDEQLPDPLTTPTTNIYLPETKGPSTGAIVALSLLAVGLVGGIVLINR